MMRVRIEEAEWSERAVVTRLPFRFGAITLRETGEAHCRLRIVVNGTEAEGRSAQLMVPRWFDKREELTGPETVEELRESVRTACAAAPGLEGPAAAITEDLRSEVRARMLEGTPGLAAEYGPALVEMALIDAICRAAGLPFWKAATADLFGLAGHLPADLGKADLEGSLGGIKAPARLRLRHTVGYDSPLTRDEVGPDAPQDGLPVSLEEVIERHGVSAFKIKLKGEPEADLARLGAVRAVVDRCAGLAVTLDANEQYGAAEFADFLRGFREDAGLAPLRDALRFVEQPFDRAEALSAPVPEDIGVPLVIDESDDRRDAFADALALDWSGTSIKSGKGVLRALLNKARAEAAGALLSGEDLTCQPGLAWQQDTAMAAACGVRDVERNGHHFAGGMQGAPEEEVAARLAAHPDIYVSKGGRPGLRIEAGEVAIGSLDCPGFGGI
ncbi:enolase C-terminal domain-like protein [Roseicyclus sp. F158]|uniref:Enolase C-terminal domain-like protein n=1 Tax=Tropicimonas omnivorans TaxID=3075590 RepID=A0ABU3DG45_9RHOB|nr:enolase C-terminal domain-like protein [Roseicyclus sp. F158]MDT0682668.1 enolase C-terminal domain-like protein [Roseicyclus sp. F158]